METSMTAHRQLIDEMLADASQRGHVRLSFAATHLLWLQGTSVQNVLMFDYGFDPLGGTLSRGPVRMEIEHCFQPAVSVELNRVPGSNEAEKIAWLVHHGIESIDYIEFPDETTLTNLEKYGSYNYANTICRRVRDSLLASGASNRWGHRS